MFQNPFDGLGCLLTKRTLKMFPISFDDYRSKRNKCATGQRINRITKMFQNPFGKATTFMVLTFAFWLQENLREDVVCQ